MKATELRVGNIVTKESYDQGEKTFSREYKVRGNDLADLEIDGYIDHNDERLEPTPLTEDWLLRFGFEDWGIDYSNEGEQYVLHNVIDGTSNFEVSVVGERFYPRIDEDACCWYKFEYVHQLQNLYFALTNTELGLI